MAWRAFCRVEAGDAESVFEGPTLELEEEDEGGGGGAAVPIHERTLLLVWPGQEQGGAVETDDWGDPVYPSWEADCLAAYLDAGGQTVAYAGERLETAPVLEGYEADVGITSSARFQQMLKAKCALSQTCPLPNFPSFANDDLTVWRRRRGK